MVNQDIVNWLVDRIINRKINPQTGLPFKLEDIKVQEYKEAVNLKLTS